MLALQERHAMPHQIIEGIPMHHVLAAIHIVNGCKHMVHWDAFDDLMRHGVPFLQS